MSVTDEIKARLDVVEVVSNYIPLKKAGRTYKALCPFHGEKTPSFVVFPDSQRWRCFGACSEGGDIFNFVMKQEGMDFRESLHFLADWAGIEIAPATPQQKEADETRDRLRTVLAEAALFFNHWLLNEPDAESTREYVNRRGLTADTVRSFDLGYAPPGWDTTSTHLLEQGYQQQELIDAGLLVEREDGRTYDRFRDRLMIPIRDIKGQIVGFGARGLAADAIPKYLNSPQSEIFDKSRLLYGLSHARRSIRESETAIIVEGYMDVMQAHQAGYTNVVAQMGTAFTEPQLKLLSRYASKLILALDPDSAGQMATNRGREVIQQVSDAAADQAAAEGGWAFDSSEQEYRSKLTVGYDAQGMVRYEKSLGFDIRVVVLPEGYDPDDLIRENPAQWDSLLEGAYPIVEYMMQNALAGQNLDDPKVKVRIVDEMSPLIKGIGNSVEQRHYSQQLARALKIPEDAILGTAASPSPTRKPTRPQQQAPESPPEGLTTEHDYLFSPTRSREAFCLAALLQYPRWIYRINRILAEAFDDEKLYHHIPDGSGGTGLARQIVADDFVNPEHRRIFGVWAEALDQSDVEPVSYLIDMLDPLIAEKVGGWIDRPLEAIFREHVPLRHNDISDGRILEEITKGVITLRKKRLEEHLKEIEYLMNEITDGGDSNAAVYYSGSLAVALHLARKNLTFTQLKHSRAGKRAALEAPH